MSTGNVVPDTKSKTSIEVFNVAESKFCLIWNVAADKSAEPKADTRRVKVQLSA